MQIFIATDHGGFEKKNALIPYLEALGHTVEDCGAFTYDPADDYPDFITACARRVSEVPNARGIIIGGSGQGEAMAANRIKGIRAAVFYGEPQVRQKDITGQELSMIASMRDHNDANVLSLGARFLTDDAMKKAIEEFLTTPFSGDARHIRRLEKF
jgi:ribose 5-phosphate isomerase B